MPRISSRQKCLRQVRQQLELQLALQMDDSSSNGNSADSFERIGLFSENESSHSTDLMDSSKDSDIEDAIMQFNDNPKDLFELYFVLYNSRYLVPRQLSPKSTEFASQYFHKLPDKLFRQLTRMDKSSFFHLLRMIEQHSIFQTNNAHQQTPIARQLAVCLDRIGHEGNGACLNHVIPTWGVSCGSLVNFSKHCFRALESVLSDQIVWPKRDERQALSDEFAAHGFPGCVGLIDGSLLPLAQRPAKDGECYYDRKSRYSINTQVVCDQKRQIIFMFTGMPGSCADLTCLKKSPIWQYCNQIGSNLAFDEGQYLLGDSGYQALPHLVCSFKRADTAADKEDFNTCVAKCRVTNKHCIGVLKSRWHSLREIKVQLNLKKDSKWMVRWITLAGQLHNYVLSQNDKWTEEDEEMDCAIPPGVQNEGDEGPSSSQASRRETTAAGNALLHSVMDHALAFNRQEGRFLHR